MTSVILGAARPEDLEEAPKAVDLKGGASTIEGPDAIVPVQQAAAPDIQSLGRK